MKKFWICFVEGTKGGEHREQPDLETATAEAKRLAELNLGRKVYVLETVGYCATPGATAEYHDMEG